MSDRNFLYVFTAGPYSTASGQEGLDALLMGSAFELQISVLFLHDGVFQLMARQNVGNNDLKQYTKAFRALHDFEVHDIYVLDASLLARGLCVDHLMITPKVLDRAGVSDLISQQHQVFTF